MRDVIERIKKRIVESRWIFAKDTRPDEAVCMQWANRMNSMCLEIIDEETDKEPQENRWIPITYHEASEEEYKHCGYKTIIDCPLPDDNDTEILVCSKNGAVFADTYFCDDGCYLDSSYDLIDDIAAWMPLPEPYTP